MIAIVGLVGCSREELGALAFGTLEAPESDTPTAFGAWTSFDTSPDGAQLTMSYYDRKSGGVGWATGTPDGDGFTWIHELVDGYVGDNGLDSGDRGKFTAQRTAPDGTVWLAYQDVTNKTLRVAHRTGPGEWSEPESIDEAGSGSWISMVLDDDGRPVIVHCNEGRKALRRTEWDGSAWSSEDLYVGATGPVKHTAAAFADGDLSVAFFDAGAGQLHLWVDGADEVVDGGGAGAWPSLLLDGDDVRLAYQDTANEDLKFATGSPGSWDKVTVDAGELRGADTAILEVDGDVRVLYFDGYDSDLRVASRGSSGWETERLDGGDAATGYHNRLIPFGKDVWWATYDYTHDALRMGKL